MLTFSPGPLRGTLSVPGDKSISHRALIIAACRSDSLPIHNLNPGADVRATINALRQLGSGRELHDPKATIDCLNSGSTARMLLGVCAGANLRAQFDGDASLRRRPMEPVAAQLRAFGARIETTEGRLPATIKGTDAPQTRRFILLTPSAQIKTALLFAGLFGDVPVSVHGDKGSRDHTERLLRYLGAEIEFDSQHVELRTGPKETRPIHIPGDFSAAAFFIVAATITPGSDITIERVGVNPTRTGLLDALQAMGSQIAVLNQRDESGEPVADIAVKSARLQAAQIGPEIAFRAIDEIPVLAVAAAFASGQTQIRGVRELRVKESDRVAAIERLLAAVGIGVEILHDGIAINGGNAQLRETLVETHGDHRVAMASAALAAASGPIAIDDPGSIEVSFPGFVEVLRGAQS